MRTMKDKRNQEIKLNDTVVYVAHDKQLGIGVITSIDEAHNEVFIFDSYDEIIRSGDKVLVVPCTHKHQVGAPD